ncbi:MAG: hypothetical protein MRY81_03495 [Donghicola eburneus]|nr:hypothetical protein [Donghicola eburneus]MCI5038727.1 hypothetical protein [Donghicola eburneus]
MQTAFRAHVSPEADVDCNFNVVEFETSQLVERGAFVFEIAAKFLLAILFVCVVILAHHHGADVVAQFSPNAY